MRFPTLRITISDGAFDLLKPGLDFLARGIANHRANGPTARTLHARVQSQSKLSYKNGTFIDTWADCVLSAREKLMARGSSRKVRLTAFEIRALALSLRLSKRLPATKSTYRENGTAKLEARLENLRRQADRRTENVNEGTDFLFARARWTNFCDWVRGELMFSWPHQPVLSIKAIRFEKRKGLRAIITATLATRHYAGLSDYEMKHLIHLLMDEFRRGRHQYTLREFLRLGSADAQAYLWPRLHRKKSLTLIALEGAEKNPCVLAAERGDKFRDRNYRAAPKQEAKPAAVAVQDTRPRPHPVATPATPSPISPHWATEPTPTRQPHPAAKTVADWLVREVPKRFWDSLHLFAPEMRNSRNAIFHLGADLPQLIHNTRPPVRQVLGGSRSSGQQDHIDLGRFLQWAGAFLLSFFREDRDRIAEVFQDACQLASAQAANSTPEAKA